MIDSAGKGVILLLLMAADKPDIRLISLDFDGTIVDWGAQPRIEPAFFEVLRRFRDAGGIWALNTGRTKAQLDDVLPLMPEDVYPDYLLLAERELHQPEGCPGTWEEVTEWNEACRLAHDQLAEEAEEKLEELAEELEPQPFVRVEREGRRVAGLVTQTEAQMEDMVKRLEALRAHLPNLGYQRNYIYLRFCHVNYHKGAILRELGRRLEIPAAQTFAAGDNYNDMEMMDPEIAAWLACPGNAMEAVKTAVRQADGFVGTKNASSGLMQAFRHFRISE